MLPSIVSHQIQRGTEDFLRTTFPPAHPFFRGLWDRFFEESGQVFKGPYVSLKLPFRPGSGAVTFFEVVSLPFTPYAHQELAFARLMSNPRSTLVSTGTGSGKTECFLYPVLDHCYRHRGEPGVKAILVYPMNALANDQAKRIAEVIHGTEALRGQVRAGLFVGESPGGEGTRAMTDSMVITSKEAMRQSPPDILLTNYKMLDYLLIRPADSGLWQENQPETLKYFVVDELHTFDGAQGTDLACLIRRLKARLRTPEGYLCGVGTSATLGGKDDLPGLRTFASTLFGEPFDEEAVITEDLLSPSEFFGHHFITRGGLPHFDEETLNPEQSNDEKEYARLQAQLWFGAQAPDPNAPQGALELSKALMQHAFFRNLVLCMDSRTLPVDGLLERLGEIQHDLKALPPLRQRWILQSVLALISSARVGSVNTPRPFLDLRVQLWARELRRMVCRLGPSPRLRFSDDLTQEEQKAHLPMVHCRECGSMGWAALKRSTEEYLANDLSAFYRGFFNRSPQLHYLFPVSDNGGAPQRELPRWVCGGCLSLGHGPAPAVCPHCGAEGAPLAVEIRNDLKSSTKNNQHYSSHDCPHCQAKDSLTLLGSRSASLLAVGISQLFATPFYQEEGKKLLAFSNGVQDASHRAGFFEARTFGFNFRSALQKVIDQQEGPLRFDELPARFLSHWRGQMDAEHFVTTFLAPDMAWREDAEAFLQGKGSPSAQLVEEVEKRITWELYSELAFRARIGRTLEKSAGAIAYPEPEGLARAATVLTEWLRNEIGGLREVEEVRVARFLNGLLHHMRVRGGVSQEVLRSYAEDWGNSWLLNRIPFLPGFGMGTRTPAFVTTHKGGTRMDTLWSTSGSPTWYAQWLQRLFGDLCAQAGDFAQDIFPKLAELLEAEGLWQRMGTTTPPLWGIAPSRLQVSAEVDHYQCSCCGAMAAAAREERSLWEDMPCTRFRCMGRMQLRETEYGYYGRLYRRGQVQRIFAAEHTGLLKREAREALEAHFKAQDFAAAPNLLSCTPTLEMGIDIGDLSTVLLCGVPPSKANYLQRVGRAGRRDGNAFTLAMAEGKPHDLYFHAEPLEMLSGAVDPPGIYLNAPMVLERQFVGYCFDRWVESGAAKTDFPRKMAQVLVSLAQGEQAGRFPFNFLAFIQNERSPLLEGFLALFHDVLQEDAVAHLRRFVEGDQDAEGHLAWKISSRLYGLAEEVESLRRRVKQVRKAIKDREESTARDEVVESELRELTRERQAVSRMIADLRDKELFNFFTDEGLLPNYAFPESGVTLRSVIYRRRERHKEGERVNEVQVYEYERPAAMAIREFAPDNTFYAEGRKVKIDRINQDLSTVESWRFCSECNHAEKLMGTEPPGACPKCGSTLWADAGQVRRMLLFRQVEASTSARDSRVDDSHESREPMFYNEQLQVEVDPAMVSKAMGFGDSEVPFGFEFARGVGFRQINFGLQEEAGSTMKVAGRDVPSEGFGVCRSCGKVHRKGEKFKHAITCRYFGKEEAEAFTDSLFLYRQFHSEAVRFLLPVTSEGAEVRLHSFVAALYLGLKKVFGGNIDHLHTTLMDEPVPKSEARKRFLVLYDSVPGGTGYLKELTKDPATVRKVLEAGLDALRSCGCGQDSDKDGCYHCLYAFRLSRDMASISRREAMGMLSEILQRWDELREVPSVGDISVNTLLGSELEARFIESLRRPRRDTPPARVSRDVVRGKPGWFVDIGGVIWEVEPQVRLGEAEGVHPACQPDFVFWPVRGGLGKPVAVFTDGFQYHADIENNRLIVAEDMEKRMGLLRSGRFRVWSLTWKDVDDLLTDTEDEGRLAWLGDSLASVMKLVDAYAKNRPDLRTFSPLLRTNAVDVFLRYLAEPEEDLWKTFAFVLALSHGKKDATLCSIAEAEELAVRALLPESWSRVFLQRPEAGAREMYTGMTIWEDELSRPRLLRSVFVPADKMQPANADQCRVICRLFDDPDLAQLVKNFKPTWRQFLLMVNWLQFLPDVRFVTTRGLMEGRNYTSAAETDNEEASTGTHAPSEESWELALRFAEPTVATLLGRLREGGVSPPEAGYELKGNREEVIAEAELAWEIQRAALLLSHQREGASLFTSRGWKVWILDGEADAVFDALLHVLSQGEYK